MTTLFLLYLTAQLHLPLYKSISGANNSSFPLCDSQGASICNHLYSCQAISRLNIPISTCCVYTPVDLGSSFEMDLDKLECSSYSGLYGFDGQENNPESWKYGVAIKYKFNFKNEYPIMCGHCEKNNGVCGYNGLTILFLVIVRVVLIRRQIVTTGNGNPGSVLSYSYRGRLLLHWHVCSD